MNSPKTIIEQALNWAENSPESTRRIIEWSDRSSGINKFWYAIHLLRIASESFNRPLRIAICGENNSGKSTLVNALIREKIAITDFFEFTFCPMVFSYGDKAQGKIIDKIDAVIEVELADLETKMRSLHEQQESDRIKRVEIIAPKKYLKKYQIADVPGVGADKRNSRIAQAFTEEIDVVIFVINATILGQSQLEQDVEKLASQFSHLCLVINKIDQIGYENSNEAIEFVASQTLKDRDIPIFPMATIDIAQNPTAQKWLKDLEQEFLLPVSEAGDSIKIIQALEKCYRQLSTIEIFLQSAYHQANRYSKLVNTSSKILKSETDTIIEQVDDEVKQWINRDGFSNLIKQYSDFLVKNQIKSEKQARKELEKLLQEIYIQQEVKSLIDVIKAFIEARISIAEGKIEELQQKVFAPFQIEQTSTLLKETTENTKSVVIYDTKNNEIKEKTYFPSGKLNSQEYNNMGWALTGGILTTGILTIFEFVAETTLLPTLTGGLSLAIPVIKLISSWEKIANWFTGGGAIDEEKLAEDLEKIRLNLAQEVVNKVFPEGVAKVIKSSLTEQFEQWQNQVNQSLWTDPNDTAEDLVNLVTYKLLRS